MPVLVGPPDTGDDFIAPTGPVTESSHIAWNGLLMGGDESNPFGVLTINGWDDLPSIDRAAEPRPGQHGAYLGPAFAGIRTITAELLIRNGSDATAVQKAIAALRRACSLDTLDQERQLQIQMGSERLMCWARMAPAGLIVPGDGLRPTGHAQATIAWEATDPRRYALQQNIKGTGLPQPGDGLAYPVVYPVDYGQPGSTGDITCANDGDTSTLPLLQLAGPATNPVVTHRDTGAVLTFGLTLAATDTVTVDCRTGDVLLNGATNRRDTVAGVVEAWQLVPGDNQISFRADDHDPSAGLVVAWRDAYS